MTSEYNVMNNTVRVSKDTIDEFVSGAIGGMAGLLIGHPMETVKVLMQNSTECPSIQTITLAIKQAGLTRFFSGLCIPLYSYGLVNAILFTTYKKSLHYFDPTGTSSKANAMAGAISGFVQLIPAVPIEVIKIQLQTNAVCSGNKLSTHNCIRRIIQSRGFCGFYSGTVVQAFRDVPGYMTYFYVYSELMKQKNVIGLNTFWTAFCCGAVSGVLSWCVSMPFDVIKTRKQAHNNTTTQNVIRSLLKENKLSSFFCGFKVVLVRAMLVNACTLAVYESAYDFFLN